MVTIRRVFVLRAFARPIPVSACIRAGRAERAGGGGGYFIWQSKISSAMMLKKNIHHCVTPILSYLCYLFTLDVFDVALQDIYQLTIYRVQPVIASFFGDVLRTLRLWLNIFIYLSHHLLSKRILIRPAEVFPYFPFPLDFFDIEERNGDTTGKHPEAKTTAEKAPKVAADTAVEPRPTTTFRVEAAEFVPPVHSWNTFQVHHP